MQARRRLLVWLLPLAVGACGGNGCSGCSEIVPKPKTPPALLIERGVQVRLTQKGFDVIGDNLVALLKTLFGATAGGAAKIDVDQLLPGAPLSISGGLGLFSGKASVRNLVLSLDLANLDIFLVPNSSPARVRIAIDKAKMGVLQGVVAGKASFLGISSDAACHLLNGVDVGKPTERMATVSATIDLVLGVDKGGKLDIKAEVTDPILHDIGFATKKDCKLAECTDQVLLEDACLECEICATGQLTSDVVVAMKGFLQPILSDLLQLVTNLLIKAIVEPSLNGKPLDVELSIDLKALVAGASPQLGALLGDANRIAVRARPSPDAFVVVDKGLNSRLDAAVFAKAAGCVVDPGPDDAAVFAKLPQQAAPPLPLTMTLPAANGTHVEKGIEAGAMLSRGVIEEALWSTLRSGLLCTSVDAESLYALSGDKIVLVAGLMDLALPGLRQIAPPNAPLRMTVGPSAAVADVPRAKIQSDGQGGVLLHAGMNGLGLRVEAAMSDRWITLLELRADAVAVLALRIDAGGKLVAEIIDVQIPKLDVASSPLFAEAKMELIAGPIAELGLSVLLSEPMTFDVDVNALLASALKLPIHAGLVGIQAGGSANDWLIIGLSLAAKAAGTP